MKADQAGRGQSPLARAASGKRGFSHRDTGINYGYKQKGWFAATPRWESDYSIDDPESVLSLGKKLSFEDVGVYELELIPGISDTLAFRIQKERKEIRQASKTLPDQQKYRSLEVIKGIGPKTSQKISQFIKILRGRSP